MESQGVICLSETFWCCRSGAGWRHKGELPERGKGQGCRINAQNLQNLVLGGRRQSPQKVLERSGQWVMIKRKGEWHLEVGSGEWFLSRWQSLRYH